jgi:hypothetical protein
LARPPRRMGASWRHRRVERRANVPRQRERYLRDHGAGGFAGVGIRLCCLERSSRPSRSPVGAQLRLGPLSACLPCLTGGYSGAMLRGFLDAAMRSRGRCDRIRMTRQTTMPGSRSFNGLGSPLDAKWPLSTVAYIVTMRLACIPLCDQGRLNSADVRPRFRGTDDLHLEVLFSVFRDSAADCHLHTTPSSVVKVLVPTPSDTSGSDANVAPSIDEADDPIGLKH